MSLDECHTGVIYNDPNSEKSSGKVLQARCTAECCSGSPPYSLPLLMIYLVNLQCQRQTCLPLSLNILLRAKFLVFFRYSAREICNALYKRHNIVKYHSYTYLNYGITNFTFYQ